MREGPIDAKPTKRFFIEMLTRDIELSEAISDLVDNSVDAARTKSPDRDLTGKWVHLMMSKNKFIIEDNCGGMSSETARDYAFKFGRPERVVTQEYSIGRFGVGMKRAIFKMGSHFLIESRTIDESFVVDVDVRGWEQIDDNWSFDFAQKGAAMDSKLSEPGLRVTVTDLHHSVSKDFGNDTIRNRLRLSIEDAHQLSIEHGLEISINAQQASSTDRSLVASDAIAPAFWENTIRDTSRLGSPAVTIRLILGLLDGKPQGRSGWDVFCNDRLVLASDKTSRTGWGTRSGIPEYHNQYSKLRGFAFFNSPDPLALPWTTTKNDIDLDSPVYRTALEQMCTMMIPVVRFLNNLDREKTLREKPLADALSAAKAVPLKIIEGATTLTEVFQSPEGAPKGAEKLPRISYTRPREIVETVQRSLKVRTLHEVGERTFDYYLENELGMDEGDFPDA